MRLTIRSVECLALIQHLLAKYINLSGIVQHSNLCQIIWASYLSIVACWALIWPSLASDSFVHDTLYIIAVDPILIGAGYTSPQQRDRYTDKEDKGSSNHRRRQATGFH